MSTSTSDPQPVQFSFEEVGVQRLLYHWDAVNRHNEWRVRRAGASSCLLTGVDVDVGERLSLGSHFPLPLLQSDLLYQTHRGNQ